MELWRRLTNDAKQAVVIAHEEAGRRNQQFIGTDHLLLGILGVEDCVGARVLVLLTGALEILRAYLESRMVEGDAEVAHDEASFTPDAREVFSVAFGESRHMHVPHIGTGHLLLGLLRVESGPAYQALKLRGVSLDAARDFATRFERERDRAVRHADLTPIPVPTRGPRTGLGYDSHRLVEGRRLVLGGVEIEYEKGLLGHSDGDVVLHAIADALLGACGLGDIGEHFPDTDPRYKDADSRALLQVAAEMAREHGWQVSNVDATVLAEAPRIGPHRAAMSHEIAKAMTIPPDRVNIKATTNEGMGFVGRGEGIAALAVVTVVAFETS